MPKSTTHKVIVSRLFQFFIGITFLLFFTSASAQVSDTIMKGDTVTIITRNIPQIDTSKTVVTIKKGKYHSPKKAALLSTILPGAGQVYNKKYWKLPIIYAGVAGLAYSFQFNQLYHLKRYENGRYRQDCSRRPGRNNYSRGRTNGPVVY